MTRSAPESEHDMDQLLQAHLQRQAATIDPRPVYDRIVATRTATAAAPGPTVPDVVEHNGANSRWARRLAWGIGAAAAVLLAFLGGLQLGPQRASAKALVQEAQAAHGLPLDRCYLVEIRKESAVLDDQNPLTAQARVIRVWTRGDRFWIESVNPQRRWAWGRDENGSVWMTFGPHRAIRFQRPEVPRWLALGCDVFAMQLETLLNEVLRDFDLQRTTDRAGAPATQVVTATLQPGRQHPSLRHAQIEMDAETKVIRRLVLNRMRLGQPFATITYTLVESQPQDDSKYVLEGHLSAPFDVYTPTTNPQKCRETLDGWFDPRNGEPFHLPNPKN